MCVGMEYMSLSFKGTEVKYLDHWAGIGECLPKCID